jgi:hypothetical protein
MEGARLAGCAVLSSCGGSLLVAAVGIALQLKFPMYGRSLSLRQQRGVSYVGKPGAVTEWRRQKAAANVYRPADRVTYIHNPNQREMPTFPCKLAPLRPYRFVPVDASNICCTRKADCYLGAQPMGSCCRVESSLQNEIPGKWGHTESETCRPQHCEKRKCVKFVGDDGVQ